MSKKEGVKNIRVKAMRVDPKLLLDALFFKLPLADADPPLPEDARIISIEREYDGNYYERYVLMIESEEFDEVKNGEPITYFQPVMTERNKE